MKESLNNQFGVGDPHSARFVRVHEIGMRMWMTSVVHGLICGVDGVEKEEMNEDTSLYLCCRRGDQSR